MSKITLIIILIIILIILNISGNAKKEHFERTCGKVYPTDIDYKTKDICPDKCMSSFYGKSGNKYGYICTNNQG